MDAVGACDHRLPYRDRSQRLEASRASLPGRALEQLVLEVAVGHDADEHPVLDDQEMAQAGEPHRPLGVEEGLCRRSRDELAAHQVGDRG